MLKRIPILATTLLFAACGGGDAADDAAFDQNLDLPPDVPAPAAAPLRATAELRNAQSDVVGTVTLEESTAGVRLILDASGLPEGTLAFHIHQTGECTPPDFTSAGPHFNPAAMQHGLENPQGPHAGDMENIEVGADGSIQITVENDRVTLAPGENSLLDADGSAVVIHAGADDHVSDPAGNAGDRIVCGVITPA